MVGTEDSKPTTGVRDPRRSARDERYVGAVLRALPRAVVCSALLACVLCAPRTPLFAADPIADNAIVDALDRYLVATGEDTAEYRIPVDLLAFVSDADGDVLAFAAQPPTAGRLLAQGSGLVLFELDRDEAAALETNPTFDFTVSDGRGGIDTATVTISVLGAPLLLKGTADAFEVALDVPTTLPVLDNDRGATTIANFTQGAAGSVTLDATGTQLVYTPQAGFAAGQTDQFTYTPASATQEAEPTAVTVTGMAPVEERRIVAGFDGISGTDQDQGLFAIAPNRNEVRVVAPGRCVPREDRPNADDARAVDARAAVGVQVHRQLQRVLEPLVGDARDVVDLDLRGAEAFLEASCSSWCTSRCAATEELHPFSKPRSLTLIRRTRKEK